MTPTARTDTIVSVTPRPALIESPARLEADAASQERVEPTNVDVYFSADVETDGPIPGPFSILSFALVYAVLR